MYVSVATPRFLCLYGQWCTEANTPGVSFPSTVQAKV